MSTKYFLKAQTPTVELNIIATSAGNVSDSCKMGFVRAENPKEGEALLTKWTELVRDFPTDEAIFTSKEALEFLFSRIEYIKQYTLVDAEGKPGVKIIDTRTQDVDKFFTKVYGTEDSSAWEDADKGIMAWLLHLFFQSTPWRNAIITGLFDSFANLDSEGLALKN